jgi:hypothetical protein
MLLTTLKWLTWLTAAGLIALLLLATVVRGSVGLMEVMIIFMLAGLVSVPGWVIYYAEKRKKQNTA